MATTKIDGQYPVRLDHVVWKVIDGKGILLNLESGAYFEANAVGLSIWEHCDGRTLLEPMAEAIAKKFRIGAGRVHRDIPPFIAELKRRGMITTRTAPARAK